MAGSVPFQDLFDALPLVASLHTPGTSLYNLLRKSARSEVDANFSNADDSPREFGPLGELVFPYVCMGAIDSTNLFDLDELIIFSFYWINRRRYRRALDVGANIGLHSVLMAKCGYEVTSFEPDPTHFGLLEKNLAMNDCAEVSPNNAAVSSRDGELEFVRVLGNTTGSHLAGSKQNPYGELERFPVPSVAFAPLLANTDLVKLDVEGHEGEVMMATRAEDWRGTDGLISIHDEHNATAVFELCSAHDLKMFSQKIGWERAASVEDVPMSHHEGTLFVSSSESMPWT